MQVARCCAAIPKQRDSLMLSYTLGFPMQRDALMLSYTLGCPFRGMSSCCHTSRAAILTSHALQQGDMT